MAQTSLYKGKIKILVLEGAPVAGYSARDRRPGDASRSGDSINAPDDWSRPTGSVEEGPHLINASRGTVVDIDARVDVLKSRHLAGAGMDVSRVEPKTAGQCLQTDAKIGYVVIEAETGGHVASLSVKHKLEEVTGTIRTRILY